MTGRMVLPDFALETYFSKWEFTARHHLTASDAESMTVSELLSLGTVDDRQAYENLHLGYTPTWGTEPLREAIASSYGSMKSTDVLGFAGAGEALFWAMQLFIEPGDHVIVNLPNYQSIESIPVAAGVEVEGLPLWSGEGSDLRWVLDLDRFEAMIRPETSLVSVNFPNNPTGFVPDPATWSRFNAICHERGIRVVSDEVYRGVEINPAHTIPAAAEINPSAITISVMSKAYGLPGLRIGWAMSQDHAALSQLERAKHYTSICNSGPSEHLATVALAHGQQILDRNRAIVESNDRALTQFVSRHADLFDYSTPIGGCVSFLRYKGPEGAEAFCTSAVEDSGVLLLPASIYRSEVGEIPTDRIRFGIGRTNVPQSLTALDQHIAR